MGTRSQFEEELRKMPPDTPTEVLTKLAAAHFEAHLAREMDGEVSLPAINIKELAAIIQNTPPSHLRLAFDLLDDVSCLTESPGSFGTQWAMDTTRLAKTLYFKHIHPEKMGHDYKDGK